MNQFHCRNLILRVAALLLLLNSVSFAQNQHMFERIGVSDGLSQNYVQSILCDDKGFLWFGTWDGLNRYDGKQYKVFRVNPDQENSLTNSRIIDIWQDKQNTIWVKTNDNYIHYFIEETYDFVTYPYYLKSLQEQNSTITSFLECSEKQLLLGSSNSGLYHLTFNEQTKGYDDRQFLDRGPSTISNNSIAFIFTDGAKDIWIGTKRGLNNVSQRELTKEEPNFSHYWLNYEFTVGFPSDGLLFFGTRGNGIKTYEPKKNRFDEFPQLFESIRSETVTVIMQAANNMLLVGTESSGLHVFDLQYRNQERKYLDGKKINKVYKDSHGSIWINTQDYGIYKLEQNLDGISYYELTPKEKQNIIDEERQLIYEDSRKNFWIALGGSGLALYDRVNDIFNNYTHVPNDNTTISSNNVHCIHEDKNGILWVGTGAPNGGLNKVYSTADAFRSIRLEENTLTGNENIVRSVLKDTNNNLWVGTRAGKIHILDQKYDAIITLDKYPLVNNFSSGQNAYSMIQDTEGFVWIGTKGGGIYVSEFPVTTTTNYKNLRFYNYSSDSENALSLSSDLVYSIYQDSYQRIWIGTFAGGLNLVTSRTNAELKCLVFNTSNSNISSNKVRNILEDHNNRLWITTDFGVNEIELSSSIDQNTTINQSLFDPRKKNSLSYNDVIHTFEDSRNQLWFATAGGGVNKLINIKSNELIFDHLTTKDGLVNNIVYAIIEDKNQNLWFSTVQGISRFNPEYNSIDNFDRSNHLASDAFNENTCTISGNGDVIFGTGNGLLIIKPDKIQKSNYKPYLALTNFQLFNKDVDINDPKSPLRQDIETVDSLVLEHFQSSFSIEYAALSYFSPDKNRYAFILENFDNDWNEVGNQTKATYTNLPPGEYTFKIKTASWNSDWSDAIRSISITILTPWWKTETMYFIYAFLLIIGIVIVIRSYSRYHQLQNDLKVEKRVNDIKLQFFTNISHEIRTPLTLILGPIHDLLDIKNVPSNISNKLHLIEKNGKRMLRLVNQLLDFRKVQKNKMTLKVSQIELISFMKSIIENFKLVSDHKKIKIHFEPELDALQVWVDPNKFDSVIFNILSNALKFSPRGSKVIIDIDSGTDRYIDISIQDHGSGISKDKTNLIFQRFSPLAEEDEEFGSSGIGLAYSYQIMKLHHGDIMVKSEPKKGSNFIVRLTAGADHFDKEEITTEAGEMLYHVKHEKVIEEEVDSIDTNGRDHKKEGYHLLIVEDNLQILNYLKENLQNDYYISTAFNGEEAISLINKKQPDVLITDVMMPVMDGKELTIQLKQSIETSHIPVIMLTAKSTMEDQVEGVESGAEAYILKPFNMSYVRAVISNIIKQRNLIHIRFIQNNGATTGELNINNKDEKFLIDVNQLIMDNYSDPEFHIENLVEMSYVSRTGFYNKIKSLTGLTPIDFLRQKRLHIASRMLVNSDYNISEVAYNTGFNDTKNFRKNFKDLFGVTPSEFKENNMQYTD